MPLVNFPAKLAFLCGFAAKPSFWRFSGNLGIRKSRYVTFRKEHPPIVFAAEGPGWFGLGDSSPLVFLVVPGAPVVEEGE